MHINLKHLCAYDHYIIVFYFERTLFRTKNAIFHLDIVKFNKMREQFYNNARGFVWAWCAYATIKIAVTGWCSAVDDRTLTEETWLKSSYSKSYYSEEISVMRFMYNNIPMLILRMRKHERRTERRIMQKIYTIRYDMALVLRLRATRKRVRTVRENRRRTSRI